MTCYSIEKLSKLGLVLLISLSLPLRLPPSENGHPVTVAVFGLFHPERVDITTSHNAIVSLRNGSVEVKQVLGGGQRLQVESRGEWLEIKLFEHDGRLSLAHRADALRTEETVCTLSWVCRATSARESGPCTRITSWTMRRLYFLV